MTTHEFNNQASQAERRKVELDTYLTRAQSEADLVGGRFKKEITTTVNAVPQYPSLPPSSPWSGGFDQNLEPPLGFSVNDQVPNGTPKEIEASLAAIPTPVATPSADEVGDHAGEGEPVIGSTVANSLAATDELVTGSSTIKREA